MVSVTNTLKSIARWVPALCPKYLGANCALRGLLGENIWKRNCALRPYLWENIWRRNCALRGLAPK